MTDEGKAGAEMFGDFVQIGVVVADVEYATAMLTDVFGIGPFRIIDWPPADRADIERFYYGQPGDFTARMAFTELGPVELELIQPLEGESIWADFLRERGWGHTSYPLQRSRHGAHDRVPGGSGHPGSPNGIWPSARHHVGQFRHGQRGGIHH